jgi:hypothetical protein
MRASGDSDHQRDVGTCHGGVHVVSALSQPVLVVGHFSERVYACVSFCVTSPNSISTSPCYWPYSVGGMGVLKSAMHRAFSDDSWYVQMCDGSLVVEGRLRGVL